MPCRSRTFSRQRRVEHALEILEHVALVNAALQHNQGLAVLPDLRQAFVHDPDHEKSHQVFEMQKGGNGHARAAVIELGEHRAHHRQQPVQAFRRPVAQVQQAFQINAAVADERPGPRTCRCARIRSKPGRGSAPGAAHPPSRETPSSGAPVAPPSLRARARRRNPAAGFRPA